MNWVIIATLILLVIVGVEILTSPEAKGRAGEEKIYTILERLEGHKRILANCYLPNGNSGTTEMICFVGTKRESMCLNLKIIADGFSEEKTSNFGQKRFVVQIVKHKNSAFIIRCGKILPIFGH